MPPAPYVQQASPTWGGAIVCRIPRGSQQTVAALATRGQPTAPRAATQPIKTMRPLRSVTHACIHRAAARKYTARGPTGLWRGAASCCVTTGDTRQGRCQGGHAQCLCEATCYQPEGTRCTGRGACYVSWTAQREGRRGTGTQRTATTAAAPGGARRASDQNPSLAGTQSAGGSPRRH